MENGHGKNLAPVRGHVGVSRRNPQFDQGKSMKKNVVFGNLVDNAFDFLDKAGREFEEEPKYSVIHFYAALELFLKARLLHEHWTLILTKPDVADLAAFQKGDFHSVSLKEAQKRLNLIIQQGLAPDEFQCFLELGDHRNRMVHFFHQGQHAKKTDIEAIVGQQCRAWFYLHRVLTQKWKIVFADYQLKVASYDKAMHKQRQFLAEKFDQLKSDISAAQKAGETFFECPSCGHLALEEDAADAPVLSFDCLVCDFSANGVRVECPSCDSEQTLIGEPWHECTTCAHKFSDDEVKNTLLDWHVATKDNLYDGYEASCGECQGHLSVALLPSGEWMCSNCFARFEPNDIGACEWCSELTTEDIENSYSAGCEFCEGSAGWHAGKED